MSSLVTHIEKVCKNWNGKFHRNKFQNFDIAFSSKHGCGIIKQRQNRSHAECLKCKRKLKNKIIKPKKQQKSQRKNAVPRDNCSKLEQINFGDDFYEQISALVSENRLKIQPCCEVINGDRNYLGDIFASVAWTNAQDNVKIESKKKIKNIQGYQSEDMKGPGKKSLHKNCECPAGEHCSHYKGASSLNHIAKVLSKTEKGINMLALDLDDVDEVCGFKTICRSLLRFLRKHDQNHFWVVLSIEVRDRWNHSIVAQVLMLDEPKVVVIDPNEAVLNRNNMRGDWLSKSRLPKPPCRQVIKNFFHDYLDIDRTKIEFGSNRNGKASSPEIFSQFDNDCHVILIISLLWISCGFKTLPRFTQTTERSIFCKLRRCLIHNKKIPANFSPHLSRKTLSDSIKTFISV